MNVSNSRLKTIQASYRRNNFSIDLTAVEMGLSPATVKQYLTCGLKTKRYLILSDIHVPFQNEIILNKVIHLAKMEHFDGLILNGDFLDLYSIASFNDNSVKNLEGVTLGREYEQGRAVLDRLDALGIEEKVFMFGNHEERFDRFIKKGDNAKLVGALGRPEHELELDSRKYKIITDYKDGVYKLGNSLEVIHGIYTNQYPEKKHVTEFKTSIIFGHTHRFGVYSDGVWCGYNIGGLFDKDANGFKYVHRAVRDKWSNGFAIADIDELGNHFVSPVQIINNSFLALGHYL